MTSFRITCGHGNLLGHAAVLGVAECGCRLVTPVIPKPPPKPHPPVAPAKPNRFARPKRERVTFRRAVRPFGG